MSAIIQMSIDLSKIDKSKLKDGKYLNVNINVNDETKYGNNVSMCYNQTKEERDSGVKKTYLANGRVVWTDNVIKLAEKDVQNDIPSGNIKTELDNLPF